MRTRPPIIVSLCVAVLILLSRTVSSVALAQTPPTKTPFGQLPTKTTIPNALPTKPPVATSTVSVPTNTPSVLPTKTPFPTLTPIPTEAAALPTRSSTLASPFTGAPALSATFTPLPLVAGLLTIAGPSPVAPTLTLSADPIPLFTGRAPDQPVATGTLLPVSPVITQVVNLSGIILGLAALGIFLGLAVLRVGRMITREIRIVSLANLRLQYEAERIARHDKAQLRSDTDVLALLAQTILDATGASVPVRLLANGLLLSPPLLAVTGPDQTRYLFSPVAPEQLRALQRGHGLAQFVIGRSGRLQSFPLDALTSTPFIADDLRSALEYLATRYQIQWRPLPPADRWHLYVARPQPARSRLLSRFRSPFKVGQRRSLEAVRGWLTGVTARSAPSTRPAAPPDNSSRPGD
jgi:hypothetical protein